MKLCLFLIPAILMGCSQSADAAVLLYQLQGSGPGKYSASFLLDTEQKPSIVLSNSVRFNGVPVTFTRPDSSTVETASFSNTGPTFQALNNQGGLFLGYLGGYPTGFSVFGPQLFTGSTSNPQFLTGTFGLSDIPRNSTSDPLQVDYTLTVSNVASAVPEPATWALMLLGFGGVGFSMRRRKAQPKVTFA